MVRDMPRFLTATGWVLGYRYEKMLSASTRARAGAGIYNGRRGWFPVNREKWRQSFFGEALSPQRVTRATGGAPVLLCNVAINLWILGYPYGYVSMTHYITPAGLSA